MVRGRQCSHAGFTLLEVLLAIVLAAALLAGLWTLLGTYSKLFTTAPEKIARSQLASSLLDQIAADVKAAVCRPGESQVMPLAAMIGGTSARSAELVGGPHWLRLDVLQPRPSEIEFGRDRPDERRSAASSDGINGRSTRADELCTIEYRVSELRDEDRRSAAPRTQLVRREIAWEETHDGRPLSADDAEPELIENRADDRRSGPSSPLRARRTKELADEHRQAVPEVADTRFRYFDGAAWYRKWNSNLRGGLPTAVEVTIELAATDRTDATEPAADENRPDRARDLRLNAEPVTNTQQLADEEFDPAAYRQVVFLGSTLKAAVASTSAASGPQAAPLNGR